MLWLWIILGRHGIRALEGRSTTPLFRQKITIATYGKELNFGRGRRRFWEGEGEEGAEIRDRGARDW